MRFGRLGFLGFSFISLAILADTSSATPPCCTLTVTQKQICIEKGQVIELAGNGVKYTPIEILEIYDNGRVRLRNTDTDVQAVASLSALKIVTRVPSVKTKSRFGKPLELRIDEVFTLSGNGVLLQDFKVNRIYEDGKIFYTNLSTGAQNSAFGPQLWVVKQACTESTESCNLQGSIKSIGQVDSILEPAKSSSEPKGFDLSKKQMADSIEILNKRIRELENKLKAQTPL